MPTLEALETAVSDYKRTQGELETLLTRQETVLAQLETIQQQIATAKASFVANEDALKSVAAQFAKVGK